MASEFKLLSSLEKIFFNIPEDIKEKVSGSMLKNEIYSFQLAGKGDDDEEQRLKFRVEIESELAPYINMYQIGYVPVLLTTGAIHDHQCDDDYISKENGLYPDYLHRVKDGWIELANRQARSFWVSVEPNGEKVGTYPIVFKFYNEQGEFHSEVCFTLEIIDAALPETSICNTGWFHGDSLAHLHNVEILSDEYYAIVEKYLDIYVKFGHNMILTPIFTPALDMKIGGERLTNQLVKVTVTDGKYSFDFTQLKKWIDMCKRHGIRYFEMAHLFTQWGARHAPKIMATVDGEYRRIFGWETEALSDKYREFLEAMLPELVRFLEQEGVMDYSFFHVSDEPCDDNAELYDRVKKIILQFVPRNRFIDAASSYNFYERGIMDTIIVGINHMQTFLDHDVKGLWAYYCCGQRKDVSNRFMAMPSSRNRILGYQLYKYDIKGFLQWGFNFWHTQLSTKVINPYIETTGGGAFPSGDSFVVYPLDEDGEVVCSLRLYVFNEGMQDMRAMQLLEQLAGREKVLELLEEIQGFAVYPRNSQYILDTREKVNQMIREFV